MSYREDFINKITPSAVEMQKKYSLPAAAMIAQACLETGYGARIVKDMVTGKSSLNLFNIKGNGPAGTATINTKEYKNGQWVTVEAKFRAYNNFTEAFEDYASFIINSIRYRIARVQTDPVKYAEELQKAGYATDPQYASKISSIISRYNIITKVISLLPPVTPPQRTHIVAKGETLTAIAKKYGTTVKKIMEVNKMTINNPNLIHPGQVIIIPS